MYQPSMPSSKPKLMLGAAAAEDEELSSELTLASLDLRGLPSQQKSSSLPPQALNMSAAIITRENCFIILDSFYIYLIYCCCESSFLHINFMRRKRVVF